MIREAVQAVLGQALQVTIKLLDNETDPTSGATSGAVLADLNTAPAGDLQQQKRETIQAVLDVFDGRIIM